MKNRLNNILIGLLWLLGITLGACFWFNTRYGFNIFSVQHWQYLAYMQATSQPVRTSFYLSMLFVIIVAVWGLYKLLQPQFRKIILASTPGPNVPAQAVAAPSVSPTPAPDSAHDNEQHGNAVSEPITASQPASQPTTTPSRPPRLNIPMTSRPGTTTPYIPLSTTQSAHTDPSVEYADIREIFTSAGFMYKGTPRIKGVQTSILAIGTGEVLWLGATNVSTSDMQRAVDTLHGVFIDTLEDIEININAFIINATDDISDTQIMHFTDVNDLRTYISGHPNLPPDDDDMENFDAYSGYIGTVVDYIGKI